MHTAVVRGVKMLVSVAVVETAVHSARDSRRELVGNEVVTGVVLKIQQIARFLIGAFEDETVGSAGDVHHRRMGVDAVKVSMLVLSRLF